jgi:hypothetical protein
MSTTSTSDEEEGKDVDLKVYFAWLIQLIYAYLFSLALLAESVGPRVSSLVVLSLATCVVATFNIRTKQMLISMGMDQDIEAIWTGVVQLDMTAIVWSILALVLLLVEDQIGSGTTAEETQALVCSQGLVGERLKLTVRITFILLVNVAVNLLFSTFVLPL